jgi:predicted AlkP superfamily phosphohydrolase/phosphomutase
VKKLTTIVNDSKAFCLDPSRIYINLEGKYGKGSVKCSDYEWLLSELKEKLQKIQFEGQSVINKIYLNKEIFQGMYADMGPDLYLLPNYGFDLKGSAGMDTLFGLKHFKGMHTYDDAHLFVSYPLKIKTESVSIEHITGIITDYCK